MLTSELKEWLDENADKILYDFDCDEETSPLPNGWQVNKDPIEHYGGEDQGAEYYTIWQFSNGDTSVLIRINGWYQSYNGAEYENYEEVVAAQEMVTVYNVVK